MNKCKEEYVNVPKPNSLLILMKLVLKNLSINGIVMVNCKKNKAHQPEINIDFWTGLGPSKSLIAASIIQTSGRIVSNIIKIFSKS